MAFDRDLGYLWKFFDSLDAHAETHGLEALKRFTAEERERWHAISPMLDDSRDAAEALIEPIETNPPEKPTRLPAKPEPLGPNVTRKEAPTAFTVGSLIEYR